MLNQDSVFIGGQYRTPHSTRSIEVISPSTEEVIGRAPDSDRDDVAAAVAAAREVHDNQVWSSVPVSDRCNILQRGLDSLVSHIDDIAQLVANQMGMPISMGKMMLSTDAAPGAFYVGQYYLNLARQQEEDDFRPGSVPAVVWREPVGVVAAISPWNGPFNVAVNKIIPALAAGCTVVYKPAPETPFDVFWLADALRDAGLPPGALNVIPGGRETGSQLVAHPGIDKVSFTGSTAAGRAIGEICGRGFKRMSLELGGKSAAIVLEDADLDVALEGLATGAFINSGQACLAYTRILAPRSRYDEIVQGLCKITESFVVGDPLDPDTTHGPLVAERQRTRVESYLNLAREEGARVMIGGGRPDHLRKGWYITPTVLATDSNNIRTNREEIFGPVVSVIGYDTVAEAIQLANDSDYGLHGGVFTRDEDAALSIARSIRTGTFSINGFSYNAEAPFGGVKCSGIGRDTGKEALESFYELKTVNLSPSLAARFSA